MGRATPASDRLTYEDLEGIIRRKDDAVRKSYWNAHSLWSIAWLAYQAHDSGKVDFSAEKYAEATAYAMKHIAERASAFYEELDEEHRLAGIAVSIEASEAP